jgi:hypothetical protein
MKMDKPKGNVYPKQQLEIVDYESNIPYGQGGKTLDRVTAKNYSLAQEDPLYGKPLRYTVFNGELKDLLNAKGGGFRFMADVEERPRPDKPDYGPDRTIVQVYVNGEPVSKKKGGPSGGYRRSLEEDLALEAVKRRSIEGQVAIAQVASFMLAEKVPWYLTNEDFDRIGRKFWRAVEKSLDNFLAEGGGTASIKVDKTLTSAIADSEKQWENLGHRKEESSSIASPEPAKQKSMPKKPLTLGTVLTWCQSHGKEYNREWFFKNQPYRENELINNLTNLEKAMSELCSKKGWDGI